MNFSDPTMTPDERLSSLRLFAIGLSPMHPRWWNAILAEVDEVHMARHEQTGNPCRFDGTDSLDEGCYVRYRIHREFRGLPTGWSFTEGKVR